MESTSNHKAVAVRNRYGNFAQCMAIFNPSNQTRFCQNPIRCICGNAPTLFDLNLAYSGGDINAAKAFILAQVVDLSEFCGAKDKLTLQQQDGLCEMIVSVYSHLKTTEHMIFFYWFKCGKFGQFYGSIDPHKIMLAYSDFCKMRNEIIDYVEQEKRQREAEESRKNACSRAEWEQSERYKQLHGIE